MTITDDWTGKTVLIVGGSGGMGRATAQEFAQAGANLAIADINTENLPPQFLTIKGDITKVSDCADMVSKTVARFGRLDLQGARLHGGFAAFCDRLACRTLGRQVHEPVAAADAG